MRLLLTGLFSICIAAGVSFTFAADSDSLQDRLKQAEKTYRQDGPAAALATFEQLEIVAGKTGTNVDRGIATHFVGEIKWRLGDYEAAGSQLQRALELEELSHDQLQKAKTINVLGLLHWDLGDYERAKSYFREGTEIAEALGDLRLQGALLNNLSLVNDEMGDYLTSLAQYHHVLNLYEAVDFPRGKGDTLGNIGGVYLLLGRYQEALAYYQQALEISEQLESTASMSQDNGNIGLCYLGLGQADSALDYFAKASAIAAETGMAQDQAYWLRQTGNAWVLKGRYDKGLESLRTALALYQELDGKTERVEALHDMGNLYMLLGDSTSAAGHFQQAMALSREIGLARGITINLLALGGLQIRQGAFEEAAALYQQAVERAKESGEMNYWSQGLLQLSNVHQLQLRFAEADDEAQRALEIAGQIGAARLQAQAYYLLANSNRAQKAPQKALSNFASSLQLLIDSPDSELQWRTLHGQGLVLADLGEVKAAMVALNAAIGLIEGVRDRLQEERYRAGYVQDKYQVYVDLVRLQLEAGQQEEAFTTAERLRSRSFLDLVETTAIPANSSLEKQAEFALRERILQLRRALMEETGLAQPEQRQIAIGVYSQELLAAETEYQAMLDDRRLQDIDNTTGRRAPTYDQIRKQLSAGEALVEYVVGTEEIMFFVLTSEQLTANTTPIRRDDLNNKVELVRNLIRRQDNDRWKKPAQSLARYLIDPLRANGQLDGMTHLYLVPHGILNYLPFALLPGNGSDSSRLVVEEFTLTYLPTAAALMRMEDGPVKAASMLAVAPQRGRLLHAPAEARAVSALFQPESRLLLGGSATETLFKSIAANFRNLHLATHAHFNKLNPLLSGLDLEPDADNDGQLELHEILGMQLDADLVTLSACQTGLASGYFAEVPAGDDFVGLTRAFLYAGSSAVLATLWEVDDTSTLSLMESFYGDLQSRVSFTNKANALANAQRKMLASRQYKHPYFWAPFILVGDTSQGNRSPS